MSESFTIWLIKLAGRVKSLHQRVGYANIDDIERDVNTCKAQLEHLYGYALQHDVNLGPFHRTLIDLEADLQYIRDQVDRRKAPWTERALNIIVQAVNLVARMLKLPQFNLPGFHLPLLLNPGSLESDVGHDPFDDPVGAGMPEDDDDWSDDDEDEDRGEDEDDDDWSSDDEDEDQGDDEDDDDWSSEDDDDWSSDDEDEDRGDDEDDDDWSSEDDDDDSSNDDEDEDQGDDEDDDDWSGDDEDDEDGWDDEEDEEGCLDDGDDW